MTDSRTFDGDANYRGTNLPDALRQFGAWYVIMRAHDKVWHVREWQPFRLRYETCNVLWKLCCEVPHSAGKEV